jgi:hypothetical protein
MNSCIESPPPTPKKNIWDLRSTIRPCLLLGYLRKLEGIITYPKIFVIGCFEGIILGHWWKKGH